MNRKKLIVSGAFVVLILLVIYGWQKQQGFAPEQSNQVLIDGLEKQVNDIALIQISSGEDRVTLAKEGSQWLLREQVNHPVDITKIRSLLLQLAESTLLEQKTSDSKLYSNLGLDDDSRVEIAGYLDQDTTNKLFALGLGNSSALGTYVLREGETTSWLASEQLYIDSDPTSWLQTQLFDIKAADMSRFTIQHSGNQKLLLVTDKKGTDLIVDGLSADEKADENKVKSVSRVFKNLRLSQVRDASEQESLAAVASTAITRNGLQISTLVFQDGDSYWASFMLDASLHDVDIPVDNTTDTAEDILDETEQFIKERAPILAGKQFKIAASAGKSFTYKRADIMATLSSDVPVDSP